jgi:hypothetical protein
VGAQLEMWPYLLLALAPMVKYRVPDVKVL